MFISRHVKLRPTLISHKRIVQLTSWPAPELIRQNIQRIVHAVIKCLNIVMEWIRTVLSCCLVIDRVARFLFRFIQLIPLVVLMMIILSQILLRFLQILILLLWLHYQLSLRIILLMMVWPIIFKPRILTTQKPRSCFNLPCVIRRQLFIILFLELIRTIVVVVIWFNILLLDLNAIYSGYYQLIVWFLELLLLLLILLVEHQLFVGLGQTKSVWEDIRVLLFTLRSVLRLIVS